MKFPESPAIERGSLYEARRYLSDCGGFRVSVFEYDNDMSTRWYAERWEDTPTGGCWEIISTHRKRETAERACRREKRSEA